MKNEAEIPVLPGDLRYPPMHDKQTEAEREAELRKAAINREGR